MARYASSVPRESDPGKIAVLRAIFADSASNVPVFTGTARTGGYRPDEGLENLLPGLTPYGCRVALKEAIVRFLDGNGKPTLERSAGDREMHLDAACYYHFRVRVEGVALFVKVLLEDDGNDPSARVISVKRDDRGRGARE